MNNRLQLFLTIIIFIQIYFIIKRIRRKKLSIRFGILWIFFTLIMEFGILFPKFIFYISDFFGFEAASNMILILFIFFLFYVSLLLSIRISKQNDQIKTLVQEISILKKEKTK